MTIKLTWRKTDAYYTFVKCEGIATKDHLPVEYVTGEGAKFWFVSYTRQHIQLSGSQYKDMPLSSFPGTLYKGTALSYKQHEALIGYMTIAAKRLALLKEFAKTAEFVVDEI